MPIYYGEVSHKGDNAGALRTVNGVTDESAIASIFKVRPPKSLGVSSNSKIPASDLFNADDNQLYIDPSEMSVVTDNLAFFRRYKDSIPTDRANSLAVYLQQHYRSQLAEYARNLQPSQDFNLLDKKSIQAVALGLINKLNPQEVVEQIRLQKPISEYSLLKRHVEMLLHGMSEQFEFNVHGLDVTLAIKLASISFAKRGINSSFKIDFVRILGSFDSLGAKASGAKSSYLKLVEDIKKLPKSMDSTFKFENDWDETSFGEIKNARQYLEAQSEFKRMLKRNMWKVKRDFVQSAEAIEIPVEDEEVLTKYNFARAIANFYNEVGVAKSNLGIKTTSLDQESLESLSAGTISSKEFMLANNDVFARRFKAYLRKVYKSENANANYADRLIDELSPAVVKQMNRATLEFKVSEQVAKATEAYFAEEIESLGQAWELLGVYKSFNQIKDKAIMDRARTAIEALLPSWQGNENLSKADILDALKKGLKAVIDDTVRVEGSFSGDFDKYVSELYSKLSTTLTDDVADFIKAHSNENEVGLTKDNVEEQAKIWMVTYKRDDIVALIKKKQFADTPVEYLFMKIKSNIDARLGANLADYTIQHEDVTATERLKTIIENKVRDNQVPNIEALVNDNAKYTGFENEVVLAFIDSINRSYASDKRNIEEDSLTAYGQVHADKITAFLDDNLKGKGVDVATRKKAQEKLLDLAVEHELKPFLEVKAQDKLDFKFKLSMLDNRLEVLRELSRQCPADFSKDYYVSALKEFNNSFEDVTNEVGQDKVNEVLKQLRNKAEAYDFGFVLRELVMFWPFNKDTFTRYLNDAVVNEVKARIDAKDEAVLTQLKPVLLGEMQLDEASSKLFVGIKNDIVNDRDDAMHKVIKNRMESYCEENRTKVFDRLRLGVLTVLKRYYFENISEMFAEKLDSPEVKVTPDDARRFEDYLYNKILADLSEGIADGLANLASKISALALAKTTVEEIAGDISETDIDARILAGIKEDLDGFIENNQGVTDDYRAQYYQRAMVLVDAFNYHYVIANLAKRVNVTDYDEQSVTSWIKRMLKDELKKGNVRPVEYDLMRYGMNPPRDLDNIIGYELNEMINSDLGDSDFLKAVMVADGSADDTVANYIDAFKRLLNRMVKGEVERFAKSHGIEIAEEDAVLTWVKDLIEAELANESSEIYRSLEFTALTLVWEKANKGEEYDFAEIAESDVVDVIGTLLEEREAEFRKQSAGGSDNERLQKLSDEVASKLSDYIALFMDTLAKAHSTPYIKYYADRYGIVVYDEEKVLAWLKEAVKADVQSKQGLTYDRIKEHALTLQYDELDNMSGDDLTDAMELIMTDRKEEFKKVCADSVTTELLKEKAIRMFMDKVQTYLAGEELTLLQERTQMANNSESPFNTEGLIREFSRYDGALSKKYITEKLNGLESEELAEALEEIVYGKQMGKLEMDYMLNQAPKDAERAIVYWINDNEDNIKDVYVQIVQERLKNDLGTVDAGTILSLTKELNFAIRPMDFFAMLSKKEEIEKVALAIKHHLSGHKPTDEEIKKCLEDIREQLEYHDYHNIIAKLAKDVGIVDYDYEALVPQIKSLVRSDLTPTNLSIGTALELYGANLKYYGQSVIEKLIDRLVTTETNYGKSLKNMIGGGDADYVNNYDYVALSKKVTSLKKIKDEIVAKVVETYPVYGKYLGENVAIYVTEGIAQDVIVRSDYVKEAIKSYRGDMEMVAYKLTTEGINRHYAKALKTALGTINVETIKEQGIETFAEFADGILSTKELEWIQRKVGSLKDVNIFGGNVNEEQELMRTYADKELSKLDKGDLLTAVEDLKSAEEDSQLVKRYAQTQVEKDAETAVRKRLDSKVGEIQKNFLLKMQAEASKALGTDLVPLDEVEGVVNELGLGTTAYQAFVGTYNSDIVKSYVNELKDKLAVDVEEIRDIIKDVFTNSVLKIVQNQTRFNGVVIYKGLLVKMFGDDYAEVISYVLSNIDQKDYVTGELVNSLRKNRGNLGDAIVSYLDNNENFKQKVTTLAGVYVEGKARKYIDMAVRDAFNSAETVQIISKGIKTFRDKTKYINLKPSDLSVDKLSLTTVKDPFDFDVQGYVLEGSKIKYLIRLFDPVISDATINVEEVASSAGNANEFKKRLSDYINTGFREVFLKQAEIDGDKMQNDFMKFGEVDNIGKKYAEEHGTDEFEAYSDEYESGNVESVSDYLEKYLPYNVVSVYYPAYTKAQENLAKKAVKKFSEAGYEMTGDMNEDRVYSYYKNRPDDAVVFLRANANVAKEAEKFVVEKD